MTEIPEANLWRSADVDGIDAFAVDLAREGLAPLEEDARRLVDSGRAAETVTAAEIDIGSLGPALDRLRDELLAGRGIALVRGFAVDRLTPAELEVVFWRIGLHLGRPVSQSVMGERLGHVTDVTDRDPHARAYRNRNELTPHADPADMLSFLCVRGAKSGGANRFVSSLTIHEELRRARPDLLDVLYRGFRYHRFGEEGPGHTPITPHRIPVFSECEGLISCRYVRQFIELAVHEDPDIDITPVEREALEAFETLAARPDLHLEFTLRPGEAIFANNFTVLHARDAFEDHGDPERRRLLLRLWLSADPPRPIRPEVAIYENGPGITPQPGREPSFPADVGVN